MHQRVVVKGLMSQRTLVDNSVPQVYVRRIVMFNAFVNDSDSEIKCNLSRFVDDVKLSGEFDTPKRWATIYKDLDKLKKWAFHEL